jgi:hypothetical protein
MHPREHAKFFRQHFSVGWRITGQETEGQPAHIYDGQIGIKYILEGCSEVTRTQETHTEVRIPQFGCSQLKGKGEFDAQHVRHNTFKALKRGNGVARCQ